LRECGISFPLCRVIVNLAPADTKKSGSVHDLAIVVALLKVLEYINDDISDSAFIGEVSLNGDVRAINGVLPMTILAKKSGIKKIFVPYDNQLEASVVDGIEVYGVTSLSRLLSHFDKSEIISPAGKYIINKSA
jgi:magnesium chelatase family protein